MPAYYRHAKVILRVAQCDAAVCEVVKEELITCFHASWIHLSVVSLLLYGQQAKS